MIKYLMLLWDYANIPMFLYHFRLLFATRVTRSSTIYLHMISFSHAWYVKHTFFKRNFWFIMRARVKKLLSRQRLSSSPSGVGAYTGEASSLVESNSADGGNSVSASDTSINQTSNAEQKSLCPQHRCCLRLRYLPAPNVSSTSTIASTSTVSTASTITSTSTVSTAPTVSSASIISSFPSLCVVDSSRSFTT